MAGSSPSSLFCLDSEPKLTTQLSQTNNLYKVNTQHGVLSSLTECSGVNKVESCINNILFSTLRIEGHLENLDSSSYKIRQHSFFFCCKVKVLLPYIDYKS